MKSDVGSPAALLAGDDEVRFLRALLEHSTDIVSIVGADGSLLFHYPPALLGYAGGENLGDEVFDFIHPDDAGAALEHFALALATLASRSPSSAGSAPPTAPGAGWSSSAPTCSTTR